MSHTLCIDFGNTRQKAALFHHGQMQDVFYFSENLAKDVSAIVDKWKPDFSILSSVIRHDQAIDDMLNARSRFHRLSAFSRLPFTIPIGKPDTVGADRLALCAAAVELHPNENNLVIGLGTAVTYNFVNVKNEFLGGAISAGMNMRMRALNQYTTLLPVVEPDWNVPLVGYDTKTNIQSGNVLGLAIEIDGFINAYKSKYHAFNVLLTGGDMVHLAPHLKNEIFADPNLLFKGLYAISKNNR